MQEIKWSCEKNTYRSKMEWFGYEINPKPWYLIQRCIFCIDISRWAIFTSTTFADFPANSIMLMHHSNSIFFWLETLCTFTKSTYVPVLLSQFLLVYFNHCHCIFRSSTFSVPTQHDIHLRKTRNFLLLLSGFVSFSFHQVTCMNSNIAGTMKLCVCTVHILFVETWDINQRFVRSAWMLLLSSAQCKW